MIELTDFLLITLILSIYFMAYILPVFFYLTLQTLPNPPLPTTYSKMKLDFVIPFYLFSII
jgi:hypothetical protein